jgi:FKBP-type peptidyl-prolyl cis-trans isomerase
MRHSALLLSALALSIPAGLPAAGTKPVRLPGLEYRVLKSGPGTGAQPTRADRVAIRYVGRLTDGSVFSTSAENGKAPTSFDVRTVIPGFTALVRLMRPGDRWQFTIPGYLAYGREGKQFTPGDLTMKRDVPPDAALIFDVELVAVTPAS